VSSRKTEYIPCVIRDNVMKVCTCRLEDDSSPEFSVKKVDHVQKLRALGLSADEIKNLDLEESILDAACGPLKEDVNNVGPEWDIDVAMDLISRQMQDLNLELEMLGMRRKALRRRTRVLGKLIQILQEQKRR